MKFGTFGLEVDSRDLSSVAFGPLCCMGMTLLLFSFDQIKNGAVAEAVEIRCGVISG